MIYLTLFFIAFISATLFPLGSEGVLVYNITQGHNLYGLIVFASAGNILGSCVNYYLGLKGEDFLEEKGYINTIKMQRYKKQFERFGGYTLLLSWVPIIGDPLTFIAGVFHYQFKYFLMIVALAKTVRYTLLALGVYYFT
ncbi:MAG: YqaA family protein [Sulfurimonadaceae bacterium]|jgi:membrane protein YqaA with SNARE-associated domain